jgi:hypothetical protein
VARDLGWFLLRKRGAAVVRKLISDLPLFFPPAGNLICQLKLTTPIFLRPNYKKLFDIMFLGGHLHVALVLRVNQSAQVVSFILERNELALIVAQHVLSQAVN